MKLRLLIGFTFLTIFSSTSINSVTSQLDFGDGKLDRQPSVNRPRGGRGPLPPPPGASKPEVRGPTRPPPPPGVSINEVRGGRGPFPPPPSGVSRLEVRGPSRRPPPPGVSIHEVRGGRDPFPPPPPPPPGVSKHEVRGGSGGPSRNCGRRCPVRGLGIIESGQGHIRMIPQSLCLLKADPGYCNLFIGRWYYDLRYHRCLPFMYTGCGGNPNNFISKKKCEDASRMCHFTNAPSYDPWAKAAFMNPMNPLASLADGFVLAG